MLYAIRLSLPDRPGTLGALATALGGLGASIVTLQVVDREGPYAVDDLCIEGQGATPEMLRETAERVRGVEVESVRRVGAEPSPLAPLALADRLARRIGDPLQALVDELPDALSTAWALVYDLPDGSRVAAASDGAPAVRLPEIPWAPLEGPRRLRHGDWMPQRWRMARPELAAVPVGADGLVLIAGRWPGMRYHPRELRALELLAGLAARALRTDPAMTA